jgi:hypothetical protein
VQLDMSLSEKGNKRGGPANSPEDPSSVLIRSYMMKKTKYILEFADNNNIRTCDLWKSAPSAQREITLISAPEMVG